MAPEYQHTLAHPIRVEGAGVHTGQRCTVEVLPAPENHGIVFDAGNADVVPAHIAFADSKVQRNTSLRSKTGATIQTVEHLLAALAAHKIDNARIKVNGAEIPILDGAAAQWNESFKGNRRSQSSPRTFIKILTPIEVRDGNRWLRIEPADTFSLDVTVTIPSLGVQRITWDANRNRFDDIANARTFVLRSDIASLQRAGYGQGASLENTIVIDDVATHAIENPHILNYSNHEFARHKALDLLGDSSLMGLPILGKVTANQPGHYLNRQLVQKLYETKSAWRVVGKEKAGGSFTERIHSQAAHHSQQAR